MKTLWLDRPSTPCSSSSSSNARAARFTNTTRSCSSNKITPSLTASASIESSSGGLETSMGGASTGTEPT